MPTKLLSLKIDHIAGVDRPANKRKFLVIKQETEKWLDKAVWIESTERYRVVDEGDGKYCVYGGDDGRKLGEYKTQKEAISSIAKSEIVKALTVEKEGDKYCLYDGDKKIGTFDSMAAARAKMKSMYKGATMLTKEQIAKISDKEVQEAIVTQQEEMAELNKKVKDLEEKVAKAPKSSEDLEKERIDKMWEGVPAAIRLRMERLEESNKELKKRAEDAEGTRATDHWIGKSKGLKYIQTLPEKLGKCLQKIAAHSQDEADEIFDILQKADTVIGKGDFFTEIGKTTVTNGGNAANITDRVQALAKEYRQIDPKLPEDEALKKVFKEHPDWYNPWRKSGTVGIGSSNAD